MDALIKFRRPLAYKKRDMGLTSKAKYVVCRLQMTTNVIRKSIVDTVGHWHYITHTVIQFL